MRVFYPLLFGLGCVGKTDNPDPEDCVNSFPVDEHALHHDDDMDHGGSLPAREDLLPEVLSEAALYTDIGAKQLHPALSAFTPQFQLWSDGAEKERWVYIPECESIDTSDMNDWRFPVGSQFFKEFSVDGKRIETRIIQRIGAGPRDFAYASYLWNDEETEATRVAEAGVKGAKGTSHDIPSKTECLRCHGSSPVGGGRPSRALGFSALQLSHGGAGLTLQQLISEQRLTSPPTQSFTVPGDAVEKNALGVLHANCGHCHNETSDRILQTGLNLWLPVEVASVEETPTWQTAVGQANRTFSDQHVSGRIVSGNPDESSVLYRMKQRGNPAQMPPLGTHQVDADGLAAGQQWIEGLK